MKIYCGKLDDLQAKRAQLETEIDENNARYNEEYNRYEDAEDEVLQPIADYANSIMRKYTALDAEVEVSFRFSSIATLRINVNQNRLHDDSSGLSWSYTLSLDPETLEVKRETNSWSGLNGTTEEAIESLKQSMAAIEEIYNTDWSSLLNVRRPKYQDYVKTDKRNKYSELKEIDDEILQAKIEDLIGKNIAVQVKNFNGAVYNATRSYGEDYAYFWITINRETPSQYQITEFPRHLGDEGDFSRGYTHRVKKATVINAIIKPLETVEF